jgi:peroxin-1
MPDSRDRKEILEACSRKIQFEDDIDLSDYAERTEGYTGADLQALTYNANLEAIHDVMKISTDQTATRSMDEAVQLNYTTLMPGSNGAQKGKSQAEKDEVVGRVRLHVQIYAR